MVDDATILARQEQSACGPACIARYKAGDLLNDIENVYSG